MFPDWMKDAPKPYSSVLVANRGEIAVRILQSARELGLKGISIYSDSDANSLHVEVSEEAIHLPGKLLSETYLNIEAIINAAKISGAEAIHPGYGFLSERSDFAKAVVDSNFNMDRPKSKINRNHGRQNTCS